MIDEFFNALRDIHPWLVPIVRAAAVLLGLFALWIIFSLPLDMLWRAAEAHLASARAWLRTLASRAFDLAASLYVQTNHPLRRFLDVHRLKYVFDRNETELRRRLSALARELGTIRDGIAKGHERLGGGAARLAEQTRGFIEAEIDKPEIIFPPALELAKETVKRRKAWITLIASFVVGGALVAINTLMVSEFFYSLISYRIAGVIKASLVFGLLFCLIEITFGLALYFAQEARKEKGGAFLSIAEIVCYVAIALLIAVEAVFYALFGANLDMSVFAELFAPDPVPQAAKFLLVPLGVVIVGALVAAGHAFFSALFTLSQLAALGEFKARMQSLKSVAKRVGEDFERVRDQLKGLKEELRDFSATLAGGPAAPPRMNDSIALALGDLQTTVEAAGRNRREPYAAMDESEGLDLFRRHLFFAVATGVVIAVFLWSEFVFLDRLGILNEAPLFRLILSVFQAVVVLVASHFLVPSVRILPERDPIDVLPSANSRVAQVVAGLTIAAVVGLNLMMTVARGSGTDWLWFFMLLACIGFLMLVGRSLGTLVAAVTAAAQWLGLVFATLFVWLGGIALHLVAAAIALVGGLLAILAYPARPLLALFTSRRRASLVEAGA